MMRSPRALLLAVAILGMGGLLGCPSSDREPLVVEDSEDDAQPEPEPEGPRISQRARVEVSIGEREAYLFVEDELMRTEPVAVGREEYETPTGSWMIYRIDWNPDWRPPDSEWAEDEEFTPSGDPDNPMGRVRMVFNPPYSIHGTDELQSIGQAASHGSIRMANEAAIDFARELMFHGGIARPAAWFDRVLDEPTEMEQIELLYRIPIELRN